MAHSRFDNEKEQALRKLATLDKSKKGSLDCGIKPLISLLNHHPDYYTTSSCSGRILLLQSAPSGKKNETTWLYTTHQTALLKNLMQHLQPCAKQAGTLWLKQESAILHVCCRNLSGAKRLLGVVRDAGFKRAGIIATTRRYILEIIGTDAVAIPLGAGGKLRAPSSYLPYAVSVCNAGMKSNAAKLAHLTKALSSMKAGI